MPTRGDRNVGFQHRAYITVNEQIAWYVGVFFLLAITYMVLHAPRELSAYNVQICKEFVLVLYSEKMEVMFIYLFFQFGCTDLGNRR